MQVMLLDESVFTIGPNSEIEIEDFGFDANTGRGKIAASIGTGAFRFVSGRIAQNHPENMKVRVPNAIIGVRGTIVYGESNGTSSVVALGGPGSRRDRDINDKIGAINVATPNGAVDIRRSGYAAFIQQGSAPELRALDAASQQRIFGALNAVQTVAASQRTGAGGAGGGSGSGGSGGGGKKSAAAGGDDGGDGGSLDSLVAAAGDAALAGTVDNVRAAEMQRQLTLTPAVTVPTFVVNGNTTPQEIIGLAGTGTFTQNGNIISATVGTGTGTFDFTMTVNFGARTLAATFGNITVAGGGNNVAGVTLTIPATSYNAAPPAAFFFLTENTAGNCGAAVTCTAQAGMRNGATRAADVGIYQVTVAAAGASSNSGVLTTPPR